MVEFVPMLSTEAGRTLTHHNWQSVGVENAAYTVSDWMIKPGLTCLLSMPSVNQYMPMLPAWTLCVDVIGKAPWVIRSPFDGARLTLDVDTLQRLITHVKPSRVLLPNHLHDLIVPQNVRTYLPTTNKDDLSDAFLTYQSTTDETHYIQQTAALSPDAFCVALNTIKAAYLETNQPAADGVQGIAYTTDGAINLWDKQWETVHVALDDLCQCEGCALNLTRAHLHYLLLKTPLLAQRYMVSHNAKFCTNSASLPAG